MAVKGDNSLYFATGMDNSGLQSGAKDAVGIVSQLGQSIAGINPFLALSIGAAAAFATIANSAFKMMREFETAMKEVETISDATQKNFKGISAEVFALSKNSPDGPAKLAKAYYQIVSAGYDGAAGMRLLETASKAATAGVTSTETAADGITTTLNAFKLSAEEADQVADAMFTTVKLGKTTFEQLSSTLSQAAPLAAATGFSYQELLAAVASLTKQGVPTAQAMTQIRSGIESVSEVLGDGAAKSMTLQNAFQAIYDKAGGSQTELKKLTGRMEAMSAILGIAGPNAASAAKDLEQLGDSAGAADKAFKSMAGSNANEWAILGNRIKATTEEIGNSVLQASSGIARFLNGALEDSEQLKKSFNEQRVELAKLRGELLSVAEGSAEYNRIKNEILKNYPDFIRGIESETASTQDLLNVLNQVNEAYIQRYKFEQRQEDLKAALGEQGQIEINIDDYKDKFAQSLAELEVVAKDNGIELQIDYQANDDEILNSVKAQLTGVEGAFDRTLNSGDKYKNVLKGFATEYLSALSQSVGKQALLNTELEAQTLLVDNMTSKNRRLSQSELKTTAGRIEAIKQINAAMSASDLTTYTGSGIKEIEDAITARGKIIDQLTQINQTDNLESLKPFLDSELEEIKKYAQERFRQLNTKGGSGSAGVPDKDVYAKSLDDRKKQYEAYQAVVNQIGQAAAQSQFADLMKLGTTYSQFLQKQLQETTSAARQQAIAAAAESAGLDLKGRDKVSSVGSLTTAPIVIDFEVNTSSIKFIESTLDDLRQRFKEASKEDRGSLEGPIKMWEKRLEAAQKGLTQEEDLYSDVTRALSEMTFESLRDYISYWKKRLEETQKGSDKEAEILGKISDANQAIWQKHISEISANLGQLSGSLRDLGAEDMADLVDGLQNVGGELEGIFKMMKGDASTDEAITSGINGAIGLADIIINSAARRKAAEADYYNSVISQQKDYNRLLNEQIRIQESATENVFTTDYISKIQSGIDALKDANSSYAESLNALQDGQAKVGQRNAVDMNSVLSGVGSGAALGAAIGSVVPVIGTIVGGIVGGIAGGIVGLFGGKKKKDTFTDLLGEYPELIKTTEDGVRSLNVELAQTLVDQNLVNDATKILLNDTIAWQEQVEKAREQIAGVVSDLAGGLGDNLRNSLVEAFQAGEDAAVAMGDTISTVLQDVLAQLIFDEIFSAQFKKLQENMAASFDSGGDGTWQDDFAAFFEEAQGLTDEFNQSLQDARDIAVNNGFDVFGDTRDERTGLSGAITNITEDTADLLAGYLNAMRLDVRQGVTIAIQNSTYLSKIADNTSYNIYLESIDSRMATVERGILEFEARG
jgi:TP901 family phage tail tape measure protein